MTETGSRMIPPPESPERKAYSLMIQEKELWAGMQVVLLQPVTTRTTLDKPIPFPGLSRHIVTGHKSLDPTVMTPKVPGTLDCYFRFTKPYWEIREPTGVTKNCLPMKLLLLFLISLCASQDGWLSAQGTQWHGTGEEGVPWVSCPAANPTKPE